MDLKKFILFLAILCPALCFGQSTTVSGNVTDAGSIAWANGTVSFTFVPNPQTIQLPVSWTGGAFNPGAIITTALNGSGAYSVSIPSNTAITPSGSAWNIAVCPQATAQCFYINNQLITGPTQTINATPPAIVVTASPNILVYSTAEVPRAPLGAQIFVIGTGLQICTVVSGTSCTTWSSTGGGITQAASLPATCTPSISPAVQLTVSNSIYGPGVLYYCDSTNHFSPVSQGSGAEPLTAVFLSPQCPLANFAQCFNTPADTQQSHACSWTAATPSTVTCGDQLILASGAVASNVATYTFNSINGVMSVPNTWVNGNSVTVTGFTGGDTYLNQSCTLTVVTANSVSCPLTHANGSSTNQVGVVTNTSIGPFISSQVDVGKQVMGWQNCEAFATSAIMGTNAITTSGAPLITSFISSTQVQITTAANAQSTQTGCFVWGHPDDSSIATAEAAWVNYTFCPRVILASSNYMLTQPHFYNQPKACGAEGTINPFAQGNVFYSAGMQLEGRGTGATVLYLMPNFPNGDAGTRGIDGQSYFFVPLMAKWSDFQLTGGSQASSNISGTHSLISGQVVTLENLTLTNMGGFANGGPVIFGLTLGWQVQMYQVQNSGWGNAATQILANQGYVTAIKSSFENSLFSGVQINGPPGVSSNGYSFTCYDCRFFNSQNTSISGGGNTGNIINNKGGSVALYNTLIKDGGQSFLNGQTGYLCQTSGCVLRAINTDFKMNDATQNTSIKCTATCTSVLESSNLTSGASGNSYVDVAGSALYDLGGNGLNPLTFNVAGAIIADGRSLRGICTGTATSSTTLGLYGTGSNLTVTTCTGAVGSGIPMTQARTASTLIVTATHAGFSASSGVVTVLKNGAGTTITCTIGTGTTCNDFTHSVSFAAGDLLSLQFTTQATEVLAGVQAQVLWQ